MFLNVWRNQTCVFLQSHQGSGMYIVEKHTHLQILFIFVDHRYFDEVLNCCPFVAKNSNNHIYVHVYTGEMNANNFNNSTACISSLLSTIFTYLLHKFLEKNVIDFSACYSTVAVLISGR